MENKLLSQEEAYAKMLKTRHNEEYSNEVTELLDVVNKKIDAAIKDGVSFCSVHIDLWKGKSDQQREAVERVVDILRRKGYDANFCEYKKLLPLNPRELIFDFRESLHFKIDINFEPSLWFKFKTRLKQWFS